MARTKSYYVVKRWMSWKMPRQTWTFRELLPNKAWGAGWVALGEGI